VEETEKIFAEIVNRLPLLDKHRESLKEKRGFNDEIIDKVQIKSCSKEIVKRDSYLNDLPERFHQSLSHENIVIPYFAPRKNETGQVEFYIHHLRPHKFGIKGLPFHVYVPYVLFGNDQTQLVIAESEFKAIASCVMGVPAIGLPGIASFSGTKFNYIPDLLRSFETKKVIICFDNEIKDNPDYENYKEDFTKRFDTEFYAYVMARKLCSEAKINTLIAKLPDVCIKDGKADIDSMLAQGGQYEVYKKCIKNATTYSSYKHKWKLLSAHRSFMERRIERYFYQGPIEEDFQCYWKTKPGRESKAKLSNFTIKIINSMYSSDGNAERVCRFDSSYGVSKSMILTPDYMVSKIQFQKFCYSLGDYEFYGKDSDLSEVWRYLFMKQDGRIVNKLDHYGYHEDYKAWFFANGAYKDAEFYPASDDGIIWIGDSGYKLLDDITEFEIIPELSSERTDDISIDEIQAHMSIILGGNNARLLIGWTIANFFMPEILKTYGVFPFLFLHGKQGEGKSTIANWISSFFGFEQKGINFHSTKVGLSRITNQMSMIPIWLEEYRNRDADIGRKNNFLRSVYDKSLIVKGSKKQNEILSYKARSTLVISGEEHPLDAALNSRCIQLVIFRNHEKDVSNADAYLWLQANKNYFRQIGDHILLNKEKYWESMNQKINNYVKAFDDDKQKIESRQKIHLSIVAAACDTFLKESEEFSCFIGEKARLQDIKVRYEQALYVFFDDMANLWAQEKLKGYWIDIVEENGLEFVRINFALAYSQWELAYRGLRNDLPASKNALLDHLKKEPYFHRATSCRMNQNMSYAYYLDLSHETLPASVGTIANALKQKGFTQEAKQEKQMGGWIDD